MMQETEFYPKPNLKHRLLRTKAFFEVFQPALLSGEKLDLAKARELVANFNRRHSRWNSSEVALSDVFYAALRASEKDRSSPELTRGHFLALGTLALDDLKDTLQTADIQTAFVKGAEIAFIENMIRLFKASEAKGQGGSSDPD